jgi:hypothetical protein
MTYDHSDPSSYLRNLWRTEEASSNAKIEAAKGIYVGSERDDQLAKQLKRLTLNAARRRDPHLPFSAGNRAYGKGLVLVGASGAGKTTLLEEAFKTNPAFPNYGQSDVWCPLVSVTAPAPCTLLQLAMRILGKLDYKPTRELRENAAWGRVRDQLGEQKRLFLHIGDLQRVLHQLSEEEIQKVRDTLTDLMSWDEWPVQLILNGLPGLIPFVRHDIQLRRRLRYMSLSRLSVEQHAGFVAAAIKKYAETAGLAVQIDAEQAIVGRLLHAAQYEMGTTLEIIGEAVEFAVERADGKLTVVDFADAYAERNLLPDDQNPFMAYDWSRIDTSRLVPKKDGEEEDGEFAETPQSTRRRRKKS